MLDIKRLDHFGLVAGTIKDLSVTKIKQPFSPVLLLSYSHQERKYCL